jgi:hypothetical protein
MPISEDHPSTTRTRDYIEVPAPTAWPLTMAFGITLLAAGLVTAPPLSLLGAALMLAGAVGWFREVLPREHTVSVRIEGEAVPVSIPRAPTTHPRIAEAGHRARLPLEVHPISAGVKGGLLGGVVMAALAIAYGLLSQRSVWYPINLLAAGVFAQMLGDTTAELTAFHAGALLMALLIHGVASVLVGTLYGMLLPIAPRRPILVAGVGAPILWTALLYPTIGIINPVLERRINWGWFIASQIAFGLVAGWVVSRSVRIRTFQSASVAERLGLEEGEGPKP